MITGSPEEDDGTGGTAIDVLADVLAHERRRETVGILQEAAAPLSVTDLAVELAGGDAASTDASVERVRRLRVQLYHRHLPKLADAGLVEFDPEQRIASAEESADAALAGDSLIA